MALGVAVKFRLVNMQKERKQIVRLIWLYLLLLLFEGALRKWVLPSLSNPLLLIRDPVALAILFLTYTSRYRILNIYLFSFVSATLLAFVVTMTLGHQNLFVALYGGRIYLLHIPVIFVIGSVLTKFDVLKIGKFLMWLALPVTLLIILQFYSPQSAWVNRGVGGGLGGSGFSGALGYYRPATLFSFSNGTVLFYSLVTCFVSYLWIDSIQLKSKILLALSTICVVIAIPMTISRTYFFQSIITFGIMFFLVATNVKILFKSIILAPVFILIVAYLVQVPFLQAPLEAFSTRFERANSSEGGLEGVLGDRYIGSMFRALNGLDADGILGKGIGIGSNFGSKLLTGEFRFIVGEGEWGRTIGEYGAILGSIIILSKLSLLLHLGSKSVALIWKLYYLPILLFSFGGLFLLQGNTAQPTSLGFFVITVGIIIASINDLPVSSESGEKPS